jgi:hypothetical protein
LNLEQQIQEIFLLISKFKQSAKDELEGIKDRLPIQDFQLDIKKPLPFIAVDGSQTWLWSPIGMNIWLMLYRFGIVEYELVNNQYKLINKEMIDEVDLISTLEEVVSTQSEIYQKLYEYVLENARGREHDVIAGSIMRLHERKIAFECAKKNQNVVIAIDGAFVSAFTEDLLSSMEVPLITDLIEVCEENNNILIGVSKDSRTRFLTKNITDESVLSYATLGESKRFYIKIERKKTELLGDTYFVKLHPDAPKWFRIDLGTRRDNPEEVFQIIAQYARSQILLGYPFPLTEAHKVAVTIRQFRNIYEQLLFDIGPICGFNSGEILRGFTTMTGRRKGEFHESLDFISKVNR